MQEDPEAFCRRHWWPLARALASCTGDGALGQDLAQEALARVLARWVPPEPLAHPEPVPTGEPDAALDAALRATVPEGWAAEPVVDGHRRFDLVDRDGGIRLHVAGVPARWSILIRCGQDRPFARARRPVIQGDGRS